jgi:hypothetical protein
MITRPIQSASALLGAVLGLTACGGTVSTSNFSGASRNVAQAISDLQSDATAANERKLCTNDLSSAVQTRLNAAGGDCQKAIKRQLGEIDNFEVTVQSIAVNGNTATARVKSIYAGKSRIGAILLVREAGRWKISSLR